MIGAVVLIALVAAATPDGDARVAAAASLAQRGEVDAARDALQRLIDEGQDDATVRYDLGTLALEQGDLGDAVLHLTAAVRKDPLDDDAAYNLQLAMEARTDRLADVGALQLPWRAIGERVHPTLARGALFAASLLFSLLLVLGTWLPDGRGQRFAIGGARAGALALVLALVVFGARRIAEETVHAVVLVDETEARKGAAPDAAQAFTAHAGLSGVVMERRDGAVRLRLDNGLEAWIDDAALGFVR